MLTTLSTGSEQDRGNPSGCDIHAPASSSVDSAGDKRALQLLSSPPAGEKEKEKDQHESQVASSLDQALMHLFTTR